MADWVGKAAFLLRPVHARLFERLKASTKLFADETTAPVLDPGRGRTKTGQLFAYARDERPWGGGDPPGVAYLYAPDRKAEQPIRHLQGFAGVLEVDGYVGYKALSGRNAVKLPTVLREYDKVNETGKARSTCWRGTARSRRNSRSRSWRHEAKPRRAYDKNGREFQPATVGRNRAFGLTCAEIVRAALQPK